MTGESWDLLDLEERMDLRVLKVVLVCQEMLDLLVPLVRRASLVFPGCLDTQEGKDQRALRDSKASQALMERREQGEQQANQAQGDKEDQRDLGERGDQGDPQGKLDQRVTQEATDLLDPLVREVSQGLRDQLDSLDQKDHLGLQERMVFLDTLDSEERLVSKERPAPLDPPALSDPRDPLARRDQWEIGVTPDPQVLLESRVYLERQERKGPRVTQVPLAQLARMVLLV